MSAVMHASQARSVSHNADAFATDTPVSLASFRTFGTLDALRGLAAIAIVLFHAGFLFSAPSPAEGQLAVDLFFAMSGFIISYRYDDDLCRGMSTGRFFAIRLIRLYPLFILGTMLGVVPAIVAVAAGNHEAVYRGMLEAFPQAVFMLPAHVAMSGNDVLYPLNYVSWSLALEILINVAYAATFRFWTPPRLALMLVFGFAIMAVCAADYGSLHVGWEWPHAAGGLARVIWGFTAGVVIQRLHRAGFVTPSIGWWAPVVATLLLLVVPPLTGKAIWEFTACTVAVPLIVAFAVASEPPQRFNGLCAGAGVFSYVVYSLHVPLVGFFLRAETRFHLATHGQTVWDGLMFAALLVIGCVAAHVLYDRPVRRVLTRRLRDRSERRAMRARAMTSTSLVA